MDCYMDYNTGESHIWFVIWILTQGGTPHMDCYMDPNTGGTPHSDCYMDSNTGGTHHMDCYMDSNTGGNPTYGLLYGL